MDRFVFCSCLLCYHIFKCPEINAMRSSKYWAHINTIIWILTIHGYYHLKIEHIWINRSLFSFSFLILLWTCCQYRKFLSRRLTIFCIKFTIMTQQFVFFIPVEDLVNKTSLSPPLYWSASTKPYAIRLSIFASFYEFSIVLTLPYFLS